jgi:hypothetical protein
VLITTTSSSTRRALEKQLDQAIDRQTTINNKVDVLNTQLFDYETEIVEVSINNDIAGELGPLKYLSGLTGIPMDKIINYLLLTIIFVFDPLAIALVIAANFAFEKLRPKIKENIYGEKFVDGNLYEEGEEFKKPETKEDDFLDLEETLNDGLKDLEDWDYGLDEILLDEKDNLPEVEEEVVEEDNRITQEEAERIADEKTEYWRLVAQQSMKQNNKPLRIENDIKTYN